MISQYNVQKYFEKRGNESNDSNYMLKDGYVYRKDNPDVKIWTLEEFTTIVRKAHHCDFELIWEDPGSLMIILRCNDCGAVVFASDNVEDYDDGLECPDCGNYKTYFEYWTKKDIESDEKKQNTIALYEKFAKEEEERYFREKKRGKRDDEIWVWKRITEDYHLYLKLKCDNLFRSKLRGLQFEIERYTKDDISYILSKRIIIPLSYSSLKRILWIRKLNKERNDENHE